MRALAEWVMQRRAQAIVATVTAASLPLLFVGVEAGTARMLLGFAATVSMTLSAAIVALVTLRMGWSDGVRLMSWVLLPALIWLVWRDEPSPLVTLLGATAAAGWLRRSLSWSSTLTMMTVIAMALSLLIGGLMPGLAEQVDEAAALMVKALAETNPQLELDQSWLRELLLGAIVAGYLGTLVTTLVIARWWQSMLYNPGGFRAEFYGLRLSPLFAIAGLAVIIAAKALPVELMRWLPLLIVPFIVASIGLVHGIVATKELSRSWLTAFYVALFIVGPYLIALLIMLAAVDSLIDIRKRLKART